MTAHLIDKLFHCHRVCDLTTSFNSPLQNLVKIRITVWKSQVLVCTYAQSAALYSAKSYIEIQKLGNWSKLIQVRDPNTIPSKRLR